MELFIGAFAVVMGILTPFIIIAVLLWLFWLVSEATIAKQLRLEKQLEDSKKAAPYDDIEFSQPPNPRMITVRLIKNKEVVWEESYDKEFK